ncbi:MAG: tetratricopeptide repeat protein [Chromatiales bacterium]|nr:tetratricopeptide repeat protein [Chromatiales bacterium]
MANSPHIYEVTEATFDAEVIARSHEVPVLVDFWADWCAPCRMLMPVLQAVVDSHAGQVVLAKVDTDKEQRLAGTHRVRGLPTVRLYKDGKVVEEFTGAQPESVVRAMVERHLARPGDPLRHEARSALAAGNAEHAVQYLTEALSLDPDNGEIQVELAEALAQQGDLDAAQERLDALPLQIAETEPARRLRATLMFARAAGTGGDADIAAMLAADPNDSEALYRRAAQSVVRGEYPEALEDLLSVLRNDRGFRDGAAREGMLAVFEILGPQHELAAQFRRRMAAALN